MDRFSYSLTPNTVDKAAKTMIDELISRRKKEAIKRIVKPVGNGLFVLLNFLYIYGAIYENTSHEDLHMYKLLTPLTKIWSVFAFVMHKWELEWYVFAGILAVAAFVIPLAVSAVITLIYSLIYKGKYKQEWKRFSNGGEGVVNKARRLHNLAYNLRLALPDYTDASDRKPFQKLFVFLITAFLIYGFIMIKMFSFQMLGGGVVFLAIVYWLYGWILCPFFYLNRLFYRRKCHFDYTKETEAYLASVEGKTKPHKAEQKTAYHEIPYYEPYNVDSTPIYYADDNVNPRNDIDDLPYHSGTVDIDGFAYNVYTQDAEGYSTDPYRYDDLGYKVSVDPNDIEAPFDWRDAD